MSNFPNILLIDDNEDDYEATLRGFKKNHFVSPVHWCKNGQDALDYLKLKGKYATGRNVSRPNLVLLDLNMPGIDGKRVLTQIKQDKKLCSIPVVVFTTSSDARDVEQCYSIGASTYIQKPVSFEELTKTIRTIKDYWFDVALLPSEKNM